MSDKCLPRTTLFSPTQCLLPRPHPPGTVLAGQRGRHEPGCLRPQQVQWGEGRADLPDVGLWKRSVSGMICLAVRKYQMKTSIAVLVFFYLRSRCYCHLAETLQTSRWLPLQWVLPARRRWTTPPLEMIIWIVIRQVLPLICLNVSLPDGSYVSVPSPLGKIKSMTKGSEVEWGTADFPTLLSADMTANIVSETGGGVKHRSVSVCVIFILNIYTLLMAVRSICRKGLIISQKEIYI